MLTFDPDVRRARISRPGQAPIDGQLVCYYPCPRCSNPARALVYLRDAELASQVAAQDEDVARHLGLLAVGGGLALNGGHAGYGGRECRLSLWTETPAALAHTVWEAVHRGVHQGPPDLPSDATHISLLPEVYLVGDVVGREMVPVVLYRRWSSPSELAERVAGGPWDTRRESYEAYQRCRERATETLLAMLKGAG